MNHYKLLIQSDWINRKVVINSLLAGAFVCIVVSCRKIPSPTGTVYPMKTNTPTEEIIGGTSTPALGPSSTRQPSTATSSPMETWTWSVLQTPIQTTKGTFTLTTMEDWDPRDENSFDLDEGIHTAGAESDLSFTIYCEQVCISTLNLENGTKRYTIKNQEAEYKTCVDNLPAFKGYFTEAWEVQAAYCILTGRGNLGIVTITGYAYDASGGHMGFSYILWHNPAPSPGG